MTLTTGIVIGGLVLFAAMSFFFAVAESSLFSLVKWRLRLLAEEATGRSAMVVRLLEAPQDLLATIVLGNTFANAAMVALVSWQVLSGRWPTILALGLCFVAILFGCEVVPKTLAVRVPEYWAQRVAGPMLFLRGFTRPLRQIAQRLNATILRAAVPESVQPHGALTEEEYRELLEMAYQQGALLQSEKDMLLEIIRLHRRTAKDVMRPRAQMDCISDELSVEEMVAAARAHRHRRLPIYDETPDTIVGVLNTRRLLMDPTGDLADAIEFPSFVPESTDLLYLLKSLQRQRRGLAIVLDEFGGTAGIVTTEDILESMVGDIRGEGESLGFEIERLGEGRWRVNGTMQIDDFAREYPALREVPEVDTMAGLLVAQAEVVPEPGRSVVYRGLRLTAVRADERRVQELLVEVVRR